jgi:hypothetical protein
MNLKGNNSGIIIPKTDQQVIDMFMGGFFQYLRNNGIPTPDKGLARFILYTNLFGDFKELVKKNLELEKQNMTADIMVAREAFGLYQQTRSIPPEVLANTINELVKQYAPQVAPGAPTPAADEKKAAEAETELPGYEPDEPESETPAGNVIPMPERKADGKEE